MYKSLMKERFFQQPVSGKCQKKTYDCDKLNMLLHIAFEASYSVINNKLLFTDVLAIKSLRMIDLMHKAQVP